MMVNKFINVVYFDLGDTLVRIKPNLIVESIRRIATARGQTLKRKRDIDQIKLEFRLACNAEWVKRKEEIHHVQTANQEREYWPRYFESVLNRLQVESKRSELIRLLAQQQTDPRSFECFSDVEFVLSELRKEHFKLGIISNAFPSAKKIMNELKLSSHFSYVVLSNETPFVKPQPEIYQHAANIAHVNTTQISFVDDRPGFVASAANLGIRSVLLDRAGQYTRHHWTGLKIRRLPSLLKLIKFERHLVINTHHELRANRKRFRSA
jgi:putative hydrolase of the HAD superfamily